MARPVTVWSTLSVVLMKAISNPDTPAASAPATTPSHREPVAWAVRNPANAPMSMLPSTPRFMIPERSVTSSPIAPNRSGAEIRIMPENTATMNASVQISDIGRSPGGGFCFDRDANDPGDPVSGQDVRAQHEDQRQALKGVDQGHRDAGDDLHRSRAVHERPKEDRREHRSDRVEPGEEGHDDARVAVPSRDIESETVVESGH